MSAGPAWPRRATRCARWTARAAVRHLPLLILQLLLFQLRLLQLQLLQLQFLQLRL